MTGGTGLTCRRPAMGVCLSYAFSRNRGQKPFDCLLIVLVVVYILILGIVDVRAGLAALRAALGLLAALLRAAFL